MARVDLPGDGWAVLRDPALVTERQRRPVPRAMAALTSYRALHPEAAALEVTTEEEQDLFDRLSRATVLALVDSWSYEWAVTDDGLGDLPGPAFDALRFECAKHTAELMPSFAGGPDPKDTPSTGSSPE